MEKKSDFYTFLSMMNDVLLSIYVLNKFIIVTKLFRFVSIYIKFNVVININAADLLSDLSNILK